MSEADHFIEEIERIKGDPSLDPEAKKKALKKVRKQLRKLRGAVFTGKSRMIPDELPSTMTLPELKSRIEEYAQAHKLKQYDSKELSGYAFSLALCLKAGVHDPAILMDKFKARWGSSPKEYSLIELPKDILFCMGPLPKEALIAAP